MLIVIAKNKDEVLVVTPNSRHAARGIVADDLAITESMLDDLRTPDLIDEIEPCYATRGRLRWVRGIRSQVVAWLRAPEAHQSTDLESR